MKFSDISRIFFTGLAIVLPIAITLAVIWWLGVISEQTLGPVFRFFIPDRFYLPGLGIALGIVIVFAIGLLARAWVFRNVFNWSDRLLNHIPLVKTIYGAIRDLMRMFASDARNRFDRVVLVEFEQAQIIGFVTREDFDDLRGLHEQVGQQGRVAVYFPLSYQIGGYTVFLPKTRCTALDMSLEDAMRFVLTAGMSAGKTDDASSDETPER